MSTPARWLTLLLAVLFGITMLDWAVGYFFRLSIGLEPRVFALLQGWDAWRTYGGDVGYRRRLVIILLVVAATCLVAGATLVRMSRKVSTLHGTARFGTRKEVEQANLMGSKGILFGKLGSRFLLLPAPRAVFVVAPTRSGKSTGLAIPNLLNWPDSVLVSDFKGELWEKTSGFRAAHGHEVFLFNPMSEEFRSHRWNPLDSVRRGANRPGVYTVTDLDLIAEIVYATKDGDATAQFFSSQAKNLFIGLALLVLETPGQVFSISGMLRYRARIGLGEGGFTAALQAELAKREQQLSEPCKQHLSQFLGAAGDTAAGIVATFDAPLGCFKNTVVAAATEHSDFDLRQMRRKKMAVYLVASPKFMESMRVLMTLFVSQALDAQLDVLPEQDPTIKNEVMFLLDEFPALGRMTKLVKAAGYLAGYGVRLLTIVQSRGQVVDLYGKELTRAFETNHGCRVVFASNNSEDTKDISEALGTFTELSESYNVSSRSSEKLLGSPGGVSAGKNLAPQRRSLLLPQEVAQMPFEELIAFVEGQRPIKAKKAYFPNEAVLVSRLRPQVHVAPLVVADPGAVAMPTAEIIPAAIPAPIQPTVPSGSQAAMGDANAAAGDLTGFLAERLDGVVMRCIDPNAPTDEEVQQYVAEFSKGLEEFWTIDQGVSP